MTPEARTDGTNNSLNQRAQETATADLFFVLL
jgi:hypothetical protein